MGKQFDTIAITGTMTLIARKTETDLYGLDYRFNGVLIERLYFDTKEKLDQALRDATTTLQRED